MPAGTICRGVTPMACSPLVGGREVGEGQAGPWGLCPSASFCPAPGSELGGGWAGKPASLRYRVPLPEVDCAHAMRWCDTLTLTSHGPFLPRARPPFPGGDWHLPPSPQPQHRLRVTGSGCRAEQE